MSYTQKELEQFHNQGRTVILAFRAAYVVQWSAGCMRYITRPISKERGRLPFTAKGRMQAVTPELFHSIQTA